MKIRPWPTGQRIEPLVGVLFGSADPGTTDDAGVDAAGLDAAVDESGATVGEIGAAELGAAAEAAAGGDSSTATANRRARTWRAAQD